MRSSISSNGGHKQAVGQYPRLPWCTSAFPLLTPTLYGGIPYDKEIGGKSPTLVCGWVDTVWVPAEMDSGYTERQW